MQTDPAIGLMETLVILFTLLNLTLSARSPVGLARLSWLGSALGSLLALIVLTSAPADPSLFSQF